jgi:hypothetical protein
MALQLKRQFQASDSIINKALVKVVVWPTIKEGPVKAVAGPINKQGPC